MKTFLIIAFLGFAYFAQADQLAYISQSEAEEVAAYLNKRKGQTIYLFCGCCSLVEPVKVNVIEAQAVYTGYEDYWEVEIMYKEVGVDEYNYEKIDLAYTWKKGLFRYQTLGKKFKMEHNYCVKPNDWNSPKQAEKDI